MPDPKSSRQRLPSLLKCFSSLRWKLAFSYVGVTLATILALEVVFLLVLSILGPWIGNLWMTQSALGNARQLAQLISGPLERGDINQLTHVLYQPVGLVFKVAITQNANNGYVWNEPDVVIDREGNVVASNDPERYPVGSRFQESEWPQAEEMVQNVLANEKYAFGHSDALNVLAVAVPIIGSDGKTLGALYYLQPQLSASDLSLPNLANLLAITTLLLLPCVIPLGIVFGLVTATGLTRRVRRLALASNALADGHLDQRVEDASGDELGQLSRQFNRMADQIETDTVRLRELAALEVRNRLARDLHDGIKQNLFGINLAIAAALNLLESNPEAAGAKLAEAKDSSLQAQSEMQSLLNELRPAGLEEHGLKVALEEYLTVFERRQGIEVIRHIEPDLSLPLTHEQALYRIAQEALTNIARHAHATQVSVGLKANSETVTLSISDNGKGFNPSAIQTSTTLGLQGMRERLSELNGSLTIKTNLGRGTQVVACVPRPHSSESE